MQKLSEIDRTLLVMHAQEDMSYNEISLSTGLSVPAIKVKIHRVRLKLQSYLGGHKNENYS